jgi:hypothetical protein
MKDIVIWILTLFLLFAGVVLFYYGLYFFFGNIGVFAFIALAFFWLMTTQFKK